MLYDTDFQTSKADVSLKVLNAKRNICVFELEMNAFLQIGDRNIMWK